MAHFSPATFFLTFAGQVKVQGENSWSTNRFKMKDKKEQKHYKAGEMREFIKKYRLNQPMIAQAIGMDINIFRSKLYQSQQSYFFTKEEHEKILVEFACMADDIRLMIKRSMKVITEKVPATKT